MNNKSISHATRLLLRKSLNIGIGVAPGSGSRYTGWKGEQSATCSPWPVCDGLRRGMGALHVGETGSRGSLNTQGYTPVSTVDDDARVPVPAVPIGGRALEPTSAYVFDIRGQSLEYSPLQVRGKRGIADKLWNRHWVQYPVLQTL